MAKRLLLRYTLSESQNHRCAYCGRSMDVIADWKKGPAEKKKDGKVSPELEELIHIQAKKEKRKSDFNPALATIDHVYARNNNGNNDWSNMVAACSSCNSIKSNLDPFFFFYLVKYWQANLQNKITLTMLLSFIKKARAKVIQNNPRIDIDQTYVNLYLYFSEKILDVA